MEVKIVVLNGKLAGTEIPVSGNQFLIGRGEECQLRPQSGMVSRKHCAIQIAEGVATIEDLGSTNGTFVNDQRISERCELHNGDRLRVGMLGFEVRLAVGVGGRKKPKVHSIQEAASRTADSSPSLAEDLDISGWLDEEAGEVNAPTRKVPVDSGDTMAGKSLTDTSTVLAPQPQPAEEEKDEKEEKEEKDDKQSSPEKKPPGKLKFKIKPTTDSSGTAAADALRQFFHRKKP